MGTGKWEEESLSSELRPLDLFKTVKLLQALTRSKGFVRPNHGLRESRGSRSMKDDHSTILCRIPLNFR